MRDKHGSRVLPRRNAAEKFHGCDTKIHVPEDARYKNSKQASTRSVAPTSSSMWEQSPTHGVRDIQGVVVATLRSLDDHGATLG